MPVVGNLVANPLPVTGTITATGIKGTTTEVDFFISQNAFSSANFTYTVPAGHYLEISRLIETNGTFLIISGSTRFNWSTLGNMKIPAGVTISANIPSGGAGATAGIYGMLFTNT